MKKKTLLMWKSTTLIAARRTKVHQNISGDQWYEKQTFPCAWITNLDGHIILMNKNWNQIKFRILIYLHWREKQSCLYYWEENKVMQVNSWWNVSILWENNKKKDYYIF